MGRSLAHSAGGGFSRVRTSQGLRSAGAAAFRGAACSGPPAGRAQTGPLSPAEETSPAALILPDLGAQGG
ncbi:von Willebrand factor [Platysternon megacephalum]|uniref:von Willebrand factor n=1 Tax=Platysternon megacephalum TaxID=55544 RepID=A0A4D9DYQ9_9SAUR|nr:von Willebrand factor [Platysternon megacephalum]